MLKRALLATFALVWLLPAVGAKGALTETQLKCQSTVAKKGRAYMKKRFTALEKCREAISAGTLPTTTDCAAEPVTEKKLASAVKGLGKSIAKACPDSVVPTLSFGGLCFGVTTSDDLAACQLAEHDAAVSALLVTIYNTDNARVCAGGANVDRACTVNADCPASTCVAERTAGVCQGGPNNGNVCRVTADCPSGACVLNLEQQTCNAKLAKTLIKLGTTRQSMIQKCKSFMARDLLPANTDCVAANQAKLDKKVANAIKSIRKFCPGTATASSRLGNACHQQTDTDAIAACSTCSTVRQADDLIVTQVGSSARGATAVAKQIADAGDCVGGRMSRCRVGDYLIANDRIRVVVQDVQRNLFGIGQFGGQIIDGDIVRTSGPDRDAFEEWSLSLNIENTAHYTSVTVLNDGSNGGPAIIRATGVDDLLDFLNPSSVVNGFGFGFPASADDFDLPVTITTDYILAPGTNYVQVETTVQNTGNSVLPVFFGEYMNGSGELELFQSGYGFGEPLVATRCPVTSYNLCNFAAYMGVGDSAGVSYGYVHQVPGSSTFSTSGVTVPQLNVEVVLALIGAASPPFTIQPAGNPGDALALTRFFVVGGGEVSDITDARNEIECLPTGTLSGTVTVAGNPVAGADIAVLDPNLAAGPGLGALQRNVVTHTRTDAAGKYSLTLVPGTYNVMANLEGHPYEGSLSTPTQHPVILAAFDTATVDIDLPEAGAIQVAITDENDDPIPAKITLVGFDPSAEPFNTQTVLIINNRTAVFGDRTRDGYPHGVAKVIFVDPSGDSGAVAVEPGAYQAVISRGPEYSIESVPATITAGTTLPIAAKVERVIDSSGFVASDFHVHSIDSPDSRVPNRTRVLTMIDEGMDFFTPTDHDYRFGYQATINALGAANLIGTAVGEEITSFDYGHFNAWPLVTDPGQVNQGALDFGGAAPPGQDYPSLGNYCHTPDEIIALAHADAPGASNTVQVNHIHSFFGLGGGSGLAIDTGVDPPTSAVAGQYRRLDPSITNYFSSAFDALEIWIGDDRGQISTNFLGRNIGDWFNLINQGIVRTGVADSDTHGTIGGVAGFPRTMVASPTDDPSLLSGIADTLSDNVNQGRAFGTNGPMVRVSVSALSTGDTGSLEHGDTNLISTTDGNATVTVDIQSPTWVEFDTIEYYVNTTTTRVTSPNAIPAISVRRYTITPDFVQTAGVDFTVNTVPVAGTSSDRFEATATLPLTGLTEDTWVVVLVKGTDGVSRPLFPVLPNNIRVNTNSTVAQLIDGNLGEDGITALAFTNPLFIDVDGGGWTAPGLKINP